MLSELTQRVASSELSPDEVALAMSALFRPVGDGATEKTFLRAWAHRGETADELAGARAVLLPQAEAAAEFLLPKAKAAGLSGSFQGKPLLDCSGTGGGGLNLINVSTGIVFILAAMGIPVVKHGNRGLTKKSGSADVLEALGIEIFPAAQSVQDCLEEVGAAFLFATPYHESFSAVAALRRELGAEGQRTIFNLLGPLLNPARPDARLVGVFKTEHVQLYTEALKKMGCPLFTVACGTDRETGIKVGEVSPDGSTRLSGTVINAELSESCRTSSLASMTVTGAEESAVRLALLLKGREPQYGRDMLIVNAAVAAWTQGAVNSLEEGKEQARAALDSGRAESVLLRWQEFSKKC